MMELDAAFAPAGFAPAAFDPPTGGALATVPPAKPPAKARALTPAEKAAVVLVALGPEAASRVLLGIGERRIRRFAKIVSELGEVPAETVDATLAEFLSRLEDDRAVGGGATEARRFLTEVLEKDQVDRIMGDIDAAGRSVWSLLGDVEDARIAEWLGSEHPQVAAIALSRLTAQKAARVLEKFDAARADDIVLRMGPAVAADPAVAARIGEVIARDFLPAAMKGQSRKDPAELIAGMMNHVSVRTRDRLVEALEGSAPKLAESVRKIMFTFEHIPERISPRDVGMVVKAVDEATLMKAMKHGLGRSPKAVEHILANISKRLAERMREDLAALAEPSRKDGEAAQAVVVAAIVQLRDTEALKFVEQETVED